jgi:hypothetical protein
MIIKVFQCWWTTADTEFHLRRLPYAMSALDASMKSASDCPSAGLPMPLMPSKTWRAKQGERLELRPRQLHPRPPARAADPHLAVAEGQPHESSAINEHLEAAFPEPPAFPTDPFHKAVCKGIVALFSMNAIVKSAQRVYLRAVNSLWVGPVRLVLF